MNKDQIGNSFLMKQKTSNIFQVQMII